MNLHTDMKPLENNAEQAALFLKSIANRHRLMILCKLLDGGMTAGELSRELGISPPNLSQHLSWLKKEDLVNNRRQGTAVHYSLSERRIRPLMDVLYSMFCGEDPVV